MNISYSCQRLQKSEVPTNKPQAEQLDRELWRLSFQIVDSSMISDAARLSPPWKQKPTDKGNKNKNKKQLRRETRKDNKENKENKGNNER